jgi:hypothetical protein
MNLVIVVCVLALAHAPWWFIPIAGITWAIEVWLHATWRHTVVSKEDAIARLIAEVRKELLVQEGGINALTQELTRLRHQININQRD